MSNCTKTFLQNGINKDGWEIGDHTYGNPIVQQWGNDGILKIGKYCSIAGGVKILLGGNHRIDWITTYPFNVLRSGASHILGHPSTKGDVIIGNDVWLAQNCVITSGVTIGNGAVVATEAVVSSNVEPYSIVAGNPARQIRRRFSDVEIQNLLEIGWWNWSEDEISGCYDLLQSSDIEGLCRYANDIKIDS